MVPLMWLESLEGSIILSSYSCVNLTEVVPVKSVSFDELRPVIDETVAWGGAVVTQVVLRLAEFFTCS